MALVLAASPIYSSLSLYAAVLSLGVLAMIFAPQPLVRDKRVVIFSLLFVVFVVLGKQVDAFVSTICNWCWWCVECWLF